MTTLSKTVYLSESFNPGENLGFEDYLMTICEENEVIFYLWQNRQTVVIGKHQNPYKECNLANLEKDEIHLVRRRSGGGAVFHDKGNLNFTFIAHPKHYDQKKHFQVILDALKKWGIYAIQTGRNDITVEDQKFSGNAFLHRKNICCHHGTLLVDVNLQELGRYLTPPKIKLVTKGIDSVRSRVVNLKQLNEELSVESLKETLIQAFDENYSGQLQSKTVPKTARYEAYSKHYVDWDWTIGKSPKATMSHGKKYNWGNIVMDLFVVNGIIESCTVSSDTLLDHPIEKLQEKLKGVRLRIPDIESAIEDLILDENIASDLKTFVREFI